MQLLYGTGNQAKLETMRRRLAGLHLEGLHIDIIGLKDVKKKIPEVEESGHTPLDNAVIKAESYYKAFGIPVFSCDSGLYIDNIPEELQPAVHVRTINGRYHSDEEMLDYYSKLAETYGDLTARYKNAICLILGRDRIYTSMNDNLASESFIITSKPHKIVRKGFPLDSLSVDIKTGKYYYDMEESELDQMAVEDGFIKFFKKIFDTITEKSRLTQGAFSISSL